MDLVDVRTWPTGSPPRCRRSVLPSVIARGGDIRVLGVEDGTVAILEIDRLPRRRAAAHRPHRSADPRTPFPRSRACGWSVPAPSRRSGACRKISLTSCAHVLDREINPVIAAHRGACEPGGVEQGWVRLRLEGGCQGCSLAEVTLRQGIEPLLRARVPGMVGLADVTDHEAGTDPFFSAAKR